MEIIYKKVDELIPYEKNPRINDDAVPYVANSIKEFGFKVPLIIDKNNVLVTGHTRLKVAKQLGLKEVPCIIADDLSEEQIKAFRLVDNKTNEYSTWDYEKLDLELKDFNLNINISDFGFDVFEITDDDFIPDTEITKSKEKDDDKEKKTIICPHCGKEFEV